ncbi:MAG: hypothetical protein HYT34_01365, partial [Candidatus Ryanbacteria bacterium]|nr:hypothetical protein [Candidatus Ryanbacteria bacterium]
GTNQSFSAADEATFGSLSLLVGNTVQQCVFIVLDVGSSAGGGNTIEIEITASGDVAVTGASVSGTFPVQIPGTSTIRADSGTIRSPEADFDWVTGQPNWGEVIWSTTETEGDIKLRLYYTVSAACDTIVPDAALSGNAAGFDAVASPLNISGLSTVTYNRVCLEATLIAGTTVSPTLNNWALSWVPPAGVGTFNQSAYRFFQNEDGTTVVTALAALNTPALLTSQNQAFRLRLLIHRGGSALTQNGQSFKLQYAAKSGTCGAYSDVTTLSSIAFYDNPAPADGSPLTANGSLDPTHASDPVVAETYEELNNFTNSVAAIPAGQDGLWDFALRSNSAPSETTYCFRVVKSDGSLLDGYSFTPEITTAIVFAASGTYVSNPFKPSGSLPRAYNVIEWRESKTNPSCSTCSLRLQIRTAPDVGGSPGTWSVWFGPQGTGDPADYFTISRGELIPTNRNGEAWVQYRVEFSGDGSASPILEKVIINYQS